MLSVKTSRAIAESERLRLAACVQEPIRTPGAIQPHGVLLALSTDARTVLVASENAALVFARAMDEVLGAEFATLVGVAVADRVLAIADARPSASNPHEVVFSGGRWDVIVHRSGDLVIVEFEPRERRGQVLKISAVLDVMRRLSVIRSIEQLRADAVTAVRDLTGFDRVMLYHFHPDGHGEVVAEQLADGMEPYLGLHFPASDIPQQARELYLSKLSRSIVATDELVCELLALPDAPLAATVDLTLAELRSVSPYHLQFMRNMGQASTLSFSLVNDGALIGMITCAHRTERRLPFELRAILEALANQVAMQIGSLDQIERLHTMTQLREMRTVLVRQFSETVEPIDGLLDGAVSLFDVLPADGAVLSIAGARRSIGLAPSADEFEAWLGTTRAAPESLAPTNTLGLDRPELAASWSNTAGLLVVLIDATDYLALFRQEVIHTVDWLGDQGTGNRPDPLSPRVSFSSWTQSVRGTAPPWGAVESQATELGRDLEAALVRRAESHLAAAAFSDALTGLPNRRFLHERLGAQLGGESDSPVALLFIDLDRFKQINDTLGHDVGDALLIQVADRLSSESRDGDTVARLGGDEFVLVCTNASQEQAERVAERVVEAMRLPIKVREHTFLISASVGVSMAAPGVTPDALLRAADLSMYRAKAGGGDRVSG